MNLHEITLRIARELAVTKEGIATGGSASTLIDTSDRKEADDYWLGTGGDTGTVWITKSTDGLAPQGEFTKVSDFVQSTNTVSLAPSLSTAVQNGDRYAIAKRRYPLWVLTQQVNAALKDVGVLAVVDTTSITTSAGVSEYTLPLAAARDLREVYIQGVSGVTGDNAWMKRFDWYVQKSATGVASKLVFTDAVPSGFSVKLVYADEHPDVYLATDKIDELITPEYLVIAGAAKVLNWYRNKTQQNRQSLLDAIQRYENRAVELKREIQPQIPPRTGRLLLVNPRIIRYPGDQNPI